MKVYHHNDLDGRCSAAIVQREMHDCECIEVDYKDTINIDAIKPGELIYIVDFSFKPSVMRLVLDRGCDVVWIDHHKTASQYDYGVELSGLRDFNDKSRAGCELTWNYLNVRSPMPMAVALIGDYDKWALKYQPECFEFYEGMKLQNNAPTSSIWEDLFDEKVGDVHTPHTDEIMSGGRYAIRYRDNYCSDLCNSYGYPMTWEGHPCYFLNAYRFGSKAYGIRMNAFDMCIGYIHDGQQYIVSLYSEKIDVSEIAKRYGGGGHKGASGFVSKTLPWIV